MKRITLRVASSLVFLCFIATASIAQKDFRNANWGMSMAQVKAAESSEFLQEDDTRISYACSFGEIQGQLKYFFSPSDKLLRTKYFLTPDYTNMVFYIQDYKVFQDLLTQKYGKASGSTLVSSNKQTLPEAEWPAYLLAGDLRMDTKWSNEKTEILLTISKLGDQPIIQIDYVSKEFREQDIEERKLTILPNL